MVIIPSFENIENKKPEEAKEKLYLVTVEQLHRLPDGTKLTGIDGKEVIKGIDQIDEDDHPGYTAFGFLKENWPVDIELNEQNSDYINKKIPSIPESLAATEEKGLLKKM